MFGVDTRDTSTLLILPTDLRTAVGPSTSLPKVGETPSASAFAASLTEWRAPTTRHAILSCFRKGTDKNGKLSTIIIENGEILKGKLPVRALSLVKEWARKYKEQLMQDWELARQHEELKRIPSLE